MSRETPIDGDDPDCQVADLCAAIVCDDGDTCNGMESCDPVDGSCIPGNPVTCDDSNPCTDDACDPANGACFSAPVVCPAGETCDPATGTCVADDLCQNVVCDDGDACNGLKTCDPATGACLPGTAIVCDDGNLCNGMETCDSASGNCNPGQDLCPPDQQCDPQTGACMAGGTNHLQTTCLGCHGDLSAGATCATADRHVPGRVSQQVWDETLGELGLNCDTTPPDGGTPPSSGLPADHTDKEDGALHKPGKERPFTNSCTMCHGPELKGGPNNVPPSCYTCHGMEWDESGPSDGGTGAPADHIDEENGFMHKPGTDYPFGNGCTTCHGADLTGGFGPS